MTLESLSSFVMLPPMYTRKELYMGPYEVIKTLTRHCNRFSIFSAPSECLKEMCYLEHSHFFSACGLYLCLLMVVVVTEVLMLVPGAALEIPSSPFLTFKANPKMCNFITACQETSSETDNFMVSFPKKYMLNDNWVINIWGPGCDALPYGDRPSLAKAQHSLLLCGMACYAEPPPASSFLRGPALKGYSHWQQGIWVPGFSWAVQVCHEAGCRTSLSYCAADLLLAV